MKVKVKADKSPLEESVALECICAINFRLFSTIPNTLGGVRVFAFVKGIFEPTFTLSLLEGPALRDFAFGVGALDARSAMSMFLVLL